jgi:hypothetical protein
MQQFGDLGLEGLGFGGGGGGHRGLADETKWMGKA